MGAWSASLNGQAPDGLQDQGAFTAGDVTVYHGVDPTNGTDLFIWRWPGTSVAGWLVTNRSDIAEPFINDFVAAQPVLSGG